MLADRATWTLQPGDYWIESLSVASRAEIQVAAGGTARIFVLNAVTFVDRAQINTSGGSSGDVSRLALYAYGDVTLDSRTRFSGVLYAAADLSIGWQADLWGGFSADHIDLGPQSDVTYDGAGIAAVDFQPVCGGPTGSGGLVLHWRFDETTGQAALDDSGNALHGTLGSSAVPDAADPSWTIGATGCSGLDFDGVDDVVRIPDTPQLDIPSALTAAAWVRPDVIPASGLKSILSKDENFEFHIRPGGEIHYWWNNDSGTAYFINTTGAGITTGTWHHVAVTYQPGLQKVYVDGVEVGSSTRAGNLRTNSDPFEVGQDQGFGGREFDGRIDDVRIYDRVLDATEIAGIMAEAAPCVDHFEIDHDGSALTCQAELVTVRAHASGHSIAATYGGSIALSTSTAHGTWSLISGGGVFSDTGGGTATYTFGSGDAGEVVLALFDPYAETVDVGVGDGTAVEDATEDPPLVFAHAGFVFLADGVADGVGTQIAGKASSLAPGAQTLELQAVRTSDLTGACEAALQGPQNIDLAFECADPTTCASDLVRINGAPIAANDAGAPLAYTGVPLDFGGPVDSTADLGFLWDDVGRIRLHARLVLPDSGESMLGASNAFVVRPFGFDVDVPGNPAAVDASGPVFTTAGTPFAVDVRAVAWQAADDVDADGVADGHDDSSPATGADLDDNATTPSFGRELVPESVLLSSALAAPLPGNDPGLAGGVAVTGFAGGSAGTPAARFDEVGLIEIAADVASGDFLGVGAVESNRIAGASGWVGRFIPFDFASAWNAARFATGCPAGGFSYLGQPFGFDAAPVLTLTAMSEVDTTTENYAGGWLKLSNATLSGRSYQALTGTLDESGLPGSGSDPVIGDLGGGLASLSFGSGAGLFFQRSAPVGPFDAEIQLRINVVDADGVAAETNPVVLGALSPGSGIPWSAGQSLRYGRIALDNAYGSELQPLAVPLRAEVFDGVTFVPHAADLCTSVDVADISLTPVPGSLSSTPAIAYDPLASGEAGLWLSAPGEGNTGYLDLVLDLSAASVSALPWLRFDWDGDTSEDDPSARATFGVYGGSNPIIDVREIY